MPLTVSLHGTCGSGSPGMGWSGCVILINESCNEDEDCDGEGDDLGDVGSAVTSGTSTLKVAMKSPMAHRRGLVLGSGRRKHSGPGLGVAASNRGLRSSVGRGVAVVGERGFRDDCGL